MDKEWKGLRRETPWVTELPNATAMAANWEKGASAAGYTYTVDTQFPVALVDASSQASAVVATKPDIVFSWMTDQHVLTAVGALRQKGFTGPILNPFAGSSSAAFAAAKDPGYYAAQYYLALTETDQPGNEVVNRVKTLGDTQFLTNGMFPVGWVMGASAVAALNKCGDNCTGQEMNTAMESVGKIDVNGLNSDVEYSKTRHRAIYSEMYFPVGTWVSA
jgi:hypothetical protein